MIDRFDKDRVLKILNEVSGIMNRSNQFTVTMMGSAKDSRTDLKNEMERKIKLCLDDIGISNLSAKDIYPRIHIEKIPVYVEETYYEDDGCSSKKKTRQVVSYYNTKLVAD